MVPKKQYGIELWDEEGIDASILGMPEEEDWVRLTNKFVKQSFAALPGISVCFGFRM